MPSEMVSNGIKMEKKETESLGNLRDIPDCKEIIGFSMELEKGCQLTEESKTEEDIYNNTKLRRSMTQRINDTISRRLSLPVKSLKKKPEIKIIAENDEFRIPSDGNIYGFDVEQMQMFFSCFKLDSRLLDHLKEKKVDGRRFSRFTDADLERIGINNVVMAYFRDKSKRLSSKFML